MSLDLDDRQRAMLQEMGLRVWMPVRAVAPLSGLEDPLYVEATPAPAVASAVSQAAAALPAAAPTARAPLPGTAARPAQAIEGLVPAPPPQVLSTAVPPGGNAPADLAQEITACQACRLCQGRRAPVFDAAAAAQRADWLVVGDPPEAADEQAGRPFAGPAGELLGNMLRALGLKGPQDGEVADASQRAYLTSVVKCRSADAGPPELAELAACHGYLQRELALVRPRVILALGRAPALSLLQGSLPEAVSLPLGQLRGRIHRVQGVPLVVSYPPAYLLRNQADKARAWADLCLARSAIPTIQP